MVSESLWIFPGFRSTWKTSWEQTQGPKKDKDQEGQETLGTPSL